MKKASYALIGTLLISMIFISPVAQGTEYTCAGVVGAEAIWRVKTVHNGSLAEIFGPPNPSWEIAIQGSFGPKAHLVGARMKTLVTEVNASQMEWTPIGTSEFCIITAEIWIWTTSPFANVSDTSGATWIWLHPENLTTYCQLGPANVSQTVAYPFLNALPVPAATYLSELVWDLDYEISGTTVTHNVAAGYIGLAAMYMVDCTETWRYSSSYGTFLGYKLVHNNGTTAYETVLESGQAQIPGFELPIVLGVSAAMIMSLIYVIMKKKK